MDSKPTAKDVITIIQYPSFISGSVPNVISMPDGRVGVAKHAILAIGCYAVFYDFQSLHEAACRRAPGKLTKLQQEEFKTNQAIGSLYQYGIKMGYLSARETW